MTEAEWLTCEDTSAMLASAQEGGLASERKRRLFAVACCRRVWHLMSDARSRAAVDMAERFADGRAGLIDLVRARVPAVTAAERVARNAGWAAYNAATNRATDESIDKACMAAVESQARCARRAARSAGANEAAAWEAARVAEMRAQADLLRELFGPLPFRNVPLSPSWLHWNDGTVVRLARSIYEGRRFGELGILADALEEAGCAEPDLLAHCRAGGEHIAGCWAVDLVLGLD
jgi:hypothetical protein